MISSLSCNLAQMRRTLQLLPVLAAASLVGVLAPVEGQVPDKLPLVEKVEMKPYTEAISGIDRDSKQKLEAKFDMVPIPGGVFLMGSSESEPGRGTDESPQHPVKVRPFWMAKHEISWDEYDIFRRALGLAHKPDPAPRRMKDADAITGPTQPYGEGGAPDFGNDHQGHPAIRITHYAACEYCRWLSKKTGKVYRLPTEAE